MASLYELTGQYLTIYEMDIDEQTKQDTLEGMDWEEDFVNKAEGYVKVIKNLEADIPGIDEEIKRLQDRKKSLQNKVSLLKDNLQTAMEVTGNERIKSSLFTIAIQNSKASVKVDEALLPKKYWNKKVAVMPDKKGLYELLKEGKKIKGAELQENRSLRIR
jgi:hypothetical protein